MSASGRASEPNPGERGGAGAQRLERRSPSLSLSSYFQGARPATAWGGRAPLPGRGEGRPRPGARAPHAPRVQGATGVTCRAPQTGPQPLIASLSAEPEPRRASGRSPLAAPRAAKPRAGTYLSSAPLSVREGWQAGDGLMTPHPAPAGAGGRPPHFVFQTHFLSGKTRAKTKKIRVQLLAVDHSARASMKNAASCEN